MKSNDDNMFDRMDLPDPGTMEHQQELKIPLLRFKKSSKVGLWLLSLPLVFFVTVLLKYQFGVAFPVLNFIERIYSYVSDNSVLTYLIPVIFVGLPLFAMIVNFLAICHFSSVKGKQELLVTIKFRPLNLAIFFFSFAILVYAFLPDALP